MGAAKEITKKSWTEWISFILEDTSMIAPIICKELGLGSHDPGWKTERRVLATTLHPIHGVLRVRSQRKGVGLISSRTEDVILGGRAFSLSWMLISLFLC